MANSFKERADALITQWEQLKEEFWSQEWVARRIKLLQERELTPHDLEELTELNRRMDEEAICGDLSSQALDARFEAAVEALEKAAKGETDGK